jgi:regulator of ribonuclease activity A
MSHFSTADLYDRHGEAVRVLDPVLRDFGGHARFAGPAVTVKCFEDNSRIKEALAEPGSGRVLVVDAGGSLRCAMLGDLIAAGAVEQGWAGVIIDGCVRDTAALSGMPLGIKARAATPRKSTRRGEGQRELAIDIAGVRVAPGDWVYADGDGVVIATGPLVEPLRIA